MVNVLQVSAASEKAASPPEPKPAPPRKTAWGSRILTLVIVVVPLGAWFAPQLVSQFADQPSLLKIVAPELPDNLRIGKASLNWQAPILLRDVSLVKEDGSDFIKVDAVTSEQTLWDLVKNAELPLTLHFEGIQSTLVVKTPSSGGPPDMDQVAEAISQGLQRVLDYKVPKVKRPLEIHIKDGAVTLVDVSDNVLTKYSPITGRCLLQSTKAVAEGDRKRSELELNLPVAVPLGTGQCLVKADWALTTIETDPGDLQGSIELSQSPVDALHPLAANLLEGGTLTGTIDGKAAFKIERLTGAEIQSELFIQLGAEQANAAPTMFVVRGGALPAPFFLQSLSSGLGMKLSRSADRLDVSRFEILSKPLDVSLTGQVTELTGPMNAEMSGTIRCEIPDLLGFVPLEIRDQIQVEGLQLSGISVKGAIRSATNVITPELEVSVPQVDAIGDVPSPPTEPLPFAPTFAVAGTVSWQRARAYGFESGNSILELALRQDQVLPTPVDVSLNNGRLVSLPAVQLGAGAPVLVFREGLSLEKVQLSEELCRGWLRYVSPIMADATRVGGLLTVSTGPGVLPLDNAAAGTVTGTLVIQQGELGAGPVVQPILAIVDQVRQIGLVAGGRPVASDARLHLVEQNVAFALKDGRVHHANLGFYAGEVILSTSGSVGLDESLDLMLRIQMPEKWFENRGPVLTSLKGESIDVAIRGTLDHPQLDPRPLADFGKRIGTKAAGGLIFDLINRGIERRQQGRRP